MFSARPRKLGFISTLIFLLFCTSASSVLAQVLVLEETFLLDTQFAKQDGNGNPIAFFSDGDSSYFGFHNGLIGDFGGDPQPTGIGTYNSFTNNLLVVEDAGGTIDPLPVSVVWSNLDITGLRELLVGIRVGSLNESIFESDDFLRIELAVDGNPYFTVLEARANPAGLIAEDTDLDGLGDGGAFSEAVADKGRLVYVEGASLDVRLSISVDEIGEDLAVDQIFVAGFPINVWTADPAQPAAFFEAGNWSLGSVPAIPEDALIRNGGTATAIGTEGGDPASATLGSLVLGDRSGDGSLSFTGVDLAMGSLLGVGGQSQLDSLRSGTFSGTHGAFTFRDASSLSTSNLEVGNVWTFGTASVQSSGEALVENVTTVQIQTLDVGGGWARGASTADGEGSVTFRDIDTLTIRDDLDFCDSDPRGSFGELATGTCTATALFENVTQLEVGSDIEVSDGIATAHEALTQSSTVEFFDIGTLSVLDDFEIASSSSLDSGPTAGINQVTGIVRLTRTAAEITDDVDIGNFNLSTDSPMDASAALELIQSTWTTMPGSVGVVGQLSGGLDTGQPLLQATVRLRSSHMIHNGVLSVGFATNAPAGALQAKVELDDGSTLTAEQLDVGPEGALEIRLDGTAAPFNPPGSQVHPSSLDREKTLGSPTYSAIMANDATLDGEVLVVFDFLPQEGSHTFDLVRSGSAGALADTTASLTLVGLDPGFTVETFGVVTDVVDVLRLVISGAPEPVDLTVGLSNGVDSLVSGQPIHYTALISNLGPADEGAGTVILDFPAVLESCAWDSEATSGATSNGPGSGSQILEPVTLPVGGQVEYTITCHLAADAEGELMVEMEVIGSRPDNNPANDTASDTDTILDVADLSITLSDGELDALPGDLRIYTIVVANAGPRTVMDAAITDTFPPELIACAWTCEENNSAAVCAEPMGDGDISQTIFMEPGGQATYTAGCQVDPDLDPATLAIVNSASIAPPKGILDLNGTNNTAQDIDAGPGAVIFRDGFESGDLDAWSSANPTP